MINIKNFKRYMPESKDDDLLVSRILYLKSESGDDWYECQKLFSNDTIKIMYDENNKIRSINNDISTLFPDNMSVAEIGTIDPNVEINGRWFFDENELNVVCKEYSKEELLEVNNQTRSHLITEASKTIQILQDSEELGMATDEEIVLLKAWKKYRVLLSRIDTSLAPNIEWPEVPSA